MAAPDSLEDVYFDEIKDVWSANDQMKAVVTQLAKVAKHAELKKMLEDSPAGIDKHSAVLKSLLERHDEDIEQEHCRGMEGLVKEAKKHALDEKFDDDNVRDVVIISQYQRMSHYGISGFGTIASFAKTLGFDKDAAELDKVTADIYKADELMTKIAEASVNEDAED